MPQPLSDTNVGTGTLAHRHGIHGRRSENCAIVPRNKIAAGSSGGRFAAGAKRRCEGGVMSDKAVITCALNGVLTDPKQHHVPVTPEEMAREARAAFSAGASIMHIHLRQQEPNKGHLPSWDVSVSK